MSTLTGEFGAGALFGSALAAAGIYSPATIQAQMRLTDFTMLKTFIAASASGALAVHLADRTGFAPLKPRTPQLLGLFAYDGNALGGALLGAGMALTGACPGTSLVQLAAGLRSGVHVVLGGAAGGLAHVVVAPLLKRGGGANNREAAAATSGSPCGADETTPLSGSATDKKEDTVQASFRLSANALLLAWEVLCVVVIQLAGRFGGRGEGDGPGLVSPVVGGCLIGAAQAATVVLTRHTIGVSTAYENVAQALLRRASVLTPSVLFAAGILAGSAVSHLLELNLLLLALAIGIQDAVSYPDFQCFASNQTGNTVMLAVGLLDDRAKTLMLSVPTILLSLGLFLAGVLVSGQFANAIKAVRQRWWVLLSSILQTCMIAAAAILQYRFPEASTNKHALGKTALGLLAFSAGVQVAMVRALKVTDMTTAMATAAWVDIFIDPCLLAGPTKNRSRNRRAGFLLALVTGSFIGSAAYKGGGSGFALVISCVIKTVAALLFLIKDDGKVWCVPQVDCVLAKTDDT
ncbi:putative duf1275 domain protein [Neofusicoccum parvum UCRNP2]|uniref:Putative duf1275 domain protein n=1 Tax=Botryosphaeria parva (strain UCR-NP2) TaxID=1287680 RepID=R1GZW7_BOTPV|nr:putative duf1275 domain protein [Neofusicoccum parvum UCRNP2]